MKKVLLLVIGFAFLTSCSNSGQSKAEAQEEKSPPNIIFLLTDDQRADMLGFAGNEIIETPHLDRLAGEGLYFENAYVTTAICAVSRASILSGQYARRHDIWGFSRSFSEAQFSQTYPMLLQQAGYQVGFIGKYGVGDISMPRERFDFWRGFGGQGSYYQQDEAGNPLHLTQKMGNQMIEFLDSTAEVQKPFCLSVSFKAPHVQDGAPPEPEKLFPHDPAYADNYETAIWPVPVAADSQYFDHFPPTFTAGNEARKRWKNRFSTPEKYDASLEGYYRLVHGVDVVVGKLLDSLESRGLLGNTVIVFSSDHGFYLGEYGFAGKWYGSEPSVRIPMIIWDGRKKQKEGKRISEIALNIDIAPTILALADVQAPQEMQGENLLELAAGKTDNWRTDFFYEHLWPRGTGYPIPSTEGVISAEKKYMQYFEGFEADTIIFEEAYELRKDPHELNNLAQDRAFTQSLRQRMNQFKTYLK